MKISLVSSVFPYPKKGIYMGIERFVSEYSQILVKKGQDVSIITTFWNGGTPEDKYGGIKIYRVEDSSIKFGKIGRLFDLHYSTFGKNVLKCDEVWRSDIVHAISTLVTTKKLRDRGTPVVSHFHHKEEIKRLADYFVLPFHIRNEKQAYANSDIVFTMSNANRKVLIEEYGLSEDKIKVIPHGVDTSKFCRREIEKENFIILFVGALIPRKGGEYLIRAFKEVKKRNANVKLIFIGEGPERKKLELLATKLKLEVEFLGLVGDEELVHYLNKAEIFVLPSLIEGFGQAILEAMACELPVIATNTTSILEVVGDAGILVKPRNPKALAEAISTLIEDGKLRRDIGRKGRKRVEEKFSWDKIASEAIKFYEEIIKSRNNSSV
jgi:glycosyltransferase involved in cell wall biosynthesis